MKTVLLEIIFIVLYASLSESIPIKNLRFVYKGISKLVFINQKLSIECPITAQFYLWKFYRHQSEPQVLLEQENKFLSIDSVKADKTGIYECKSTTGFVNTDTNITVKVIDPSSDLFRDSCSTPMSTKPADVSKGLCFFNERNPKTTKYKIGQDAELDCTGVGTDLKYFWTFTDENGIKDQIQTGYNVSKIIIKSFIPENEGLYKCEVIDKFNQKLSQSFKVVLSDATSDINIDIVGDKQDFITTQAGQKISLKCEARNNFDRIHSVKWGKRIKNPPPDAKSNIVSWDQYTYKLLPVSDIEETHINPNQLVSTLVLAQIDAEHAGIYICLAMDTRGRTVHKIFNLTVSPTQTAAEPTSKSYFFLLYIFLPVILIFACVCIIIYCCVKSSSKKSHTSSLPLKKYASPAQANPQAKEPMPNYYYPVSNNRPPLPQPNESQASLTAPNTLTSYNSYGNYHLQSTNQPSCCSSNGV